MPTVTLRPRGPIHIGQEAGAGQQKVYAYIPSDTLFSALVVAWAQQGRAGEMVEMFSARPPFLISSAFPCLMERTSPHRLLVRLLPLPMVKLPPDNELAAKDKKRIRWVSQGVFERLIAGKALSGETSADNLAQNRTIWLLKQERQQVEQAWKAGLDDDPWWAIHSVPRVAVDRVTSATTLFHAGRLSLAAGVGLWFGVRAPSGDTLAARMVEWVQDGLRVLADSGLGGLRSAGHGAFDWAWDDAGRLTGDTPGDYAVTLSRYAPRDSEEITQAVLPRGASYRLVNVPGWCHDEALHPWRRRQVRMVTEGSVIRQPSRPAGALVDVRPTGAPQARFNGRGVYRYGYAFPVSVDRAALREVPDE